MFSELRKIADASRSIIATIVMTSLEIQNDLGMPEPILEVETTIAAKLASL